MSLHKRLDATPGLFELFKPIGVSVWLYIMDFQDHKKYQIGSQKYQRIPRIRILRVRW